MKDSQTSSKLDKIVSSVALLCVGVCFVVWADQVTEWIAILLGAAALIYSLVAFIKFLSGGPKLRTTLQLFYIILSFAAGLLLVSRASFIKEAISFIIGIYIMLTSAVQLLNLSDLRRAIGAPVGSYVWSVLGIIVGLLCVTGQFIVPDELARLTGIVMIVYAVVYLTGFLTYSRSESSASRAPRIREGEIVDKPTKEKKSNK